MRFETKTQLPDDMLKYLGLGPDALSLKRIPDLWKKAHNLIQIKTFQKTLRIDEFYIVFKPFAQKSKAINRLLTNCHSVILLLCTIGSELEKKSKTLRCQNQLFDGYILDRMGSYISESVIRKLDKEINTTYAQQNQRCTIRYSPGYQDFCLNSQHIFVQLAQEEIPFLRVRPNFQLEPEKSITAIKGIKYQNQPNN